MVYVMHQGNQGCYLDHGPYQSIECAPQWLEYLLTTSTCVLCDSVVTVQVNLGGDKGRASENMEADYFSLLSLILASIC